MKVRVENGGIYLTERSLCVGWNLIFLKSIKCKVKVKRIENKVYASSSLVCR